MYFNQQWSIAAAHWQTVTWHCTWGASSPPLASPARERKNKAGWAYAGARSAAFMPGLVHSPAGELEGELRTRIRLGRDGKRLKGCGTVFSMVQAGEAETRCSACQSTRMLSEHFGRDQVSVR
eukprot:3936780-Rhodomonas_salina.2